jgi:fumarate hydratase subunit alpha
MNLPRGYTCLEKQDRTSLRRGVSGLREVHVSSVAEAVKNLFIKANTSIGQDVYNALVHVLKKQEDSPTGRDVIGQIIKNHDISREEGLPICQDTGMAVVFADIGQDVRFVGGDFTVAVNQGVEQAYSEGFFRKSLVRDPLFDRINTGTNTPAVIHVSIVPGDRVSLMVTPKGFGSENMSAMRVLTPAEGADKVVEFVRDTVVAAGPNPCPPTIVGVGVGGTIEKAALMAKRATLRPVGKRNGDPRYAALEVAILDAVNRTGIGPGGFGGRVTCLDVHVDFTAGHIAGTPVVANICCHAARHAEVTI